MVRLPSQHDNCTHTALIVLLAYKDVHHIKKCWLCVTVLNFHIGSFSNYLVSLIIVHGQIYLLRATTWVFNHQNEELVLTLTFGCLF